MTTPSKTKRGNSTKPSSLSKTSSKKSRARKETASAFVKRVQNSLKGSGLLPPKSKILVAVSGGPDSMVLLYTLLALQKHFQWELGVTHVNYGLRGIESDQDAELVSATAQKFHLPLFILKKKVTQKKSEEALRNIRYTFFESLIKKHGYDLVALAHHQDDQAETVLLRLIRGSGSQGLASMKPRRDQYVRPLLSFPKAELLMFAEKAQVPYRLDQSNLENTYLRNRIRNELLPLLETYNPAIKKILAETAKNLQQENSKKRLK